MLYFFKREQNRKSKTKQSKAKRLNKTSTGETFLLSCLFESFFFFLESWEVGGDIFSCYFQASFLVTVGSSEASRKPSHSLRLVTPDSPGLAPLPAEDRHEFLL